MPFLPNFTLFPPFILNNKNSLRFSHIDILLNGCDTCEYQYCRQTKHFSRVYYWQWFCRLRHSRLQIVRNALRWNVPMILEQTVVSIAGLNELKDCEQGNTKANWFYIASIGREKLLQRVIDECEPLKIGYKSSITILICQWIRYQASQSRQSPESIYDLPLILA